MSLFVLDGLPEGADSLAFRNLDRKELTGLVAEHETVDIELWFGRLIWLGNWESREHL